MKTRASLGVAIALPAALGLVPVQGCNTAEIKPVDGVASYPAGISTRCTARSTLRPAQCLYVAFKCEVNSAPGVLRVSPSSPCAALVEGQDLADDLGIGETVEAKIDVVEADCAALQLVDRQFVIFVEL